MSWVALAGGVMILTGLTVGGGVGLVLFLVGIITLIAVLCQVVGIDVAGDFRDAMKDLRSTTRAALDLMPHEDLRFWAAARTVRDLGHVGALYLEGRIGSRPAYAPRHGIDQETLEHVPVLAAVNRAGFFTDQSQTGAYGGTAYVTGFADDQVKNRLHDALRGSGLSYTLERVTNPRNGRIIVGGVGPGFSTAREIRSHFGAALNAAALDALTQSWQIAIEDPEPNRNDRLWPLLGHFAHTSERNHQP